MNSSSTESEGDDEEFMRRLTRSQAALQTFIVGLTAARGDAEDILQEVNLALWRKREHFKVDQDFLPWAFGFAILEIRKFRERVAKSRLRFDDATIQALAADFTLETVFSDDRQEALSRCMEKLASRERRVITSFYSADVSAREIAHQSAMPLSSVYKVLTRARGLLRDCVQRSLNQRQSFPPRPSA